MSYRLVYTTCPDKATALNLGGELVRERLAACVNIIETVTSIYEWQGETLQEQECLMVLKTTAERLGALIEAIGQRHPYEVPEVIAVPILEGHAAYLQWVASQTKE